MNTKPSDMIGKTISYIGTKISPDDDKSYEQIDICFTDNTFIRLNAMITSRENDGPDECGIAVNMDVEGEE